MPLQNENGEHHGAVSGSLNSLKSIINKINPTEVYIVSDGENSALRRKLMLKEYKGNRKKEWKRGSCKAYDFLNEKEQRDNWSQQKKRVIDYFSIMPFKMIAIPYLEADDIIAEIANKHNNKDTQFVIYSTDADYHQIINDNVVCYSPITKKLWTKESFFEKHAMIPDNYIYLKIVQGDTSDNIQGIRGIGAKTLLKMIPKLKDEKIQSVDEFIDICQHAIDSGSKTYTKSMINKFKLIIDNKKQLQLNYNVMQLSDVNISIQSIDIIDKKVESNINNFNKMKLRFMFKEDGMYSHLKYFGDWSRILTKIVLFGRK